MNTQPHRMAVVLLVALVPITSVFAQDTPPQPDAESILQKFRDAGVPVTLDELDKSYAMPEGANAADLYVKAYDLLSPLEAGEALDQAETQLDGGDQQAVLELVNTYAEALRLLWQASKVEGCRYPIDLTKGMAAELPFLGRSMRAAKLSYLHARVWSKLGKAEATVAWFRAGLGVARSYRAEPILISQLVRIAIESLGVATLEKLLAAGGLADADLAALQAEFSRSEPGRCVETGMAGEVNLGYAAYLDVTEQVATQLNIPAEKLKAYRASPGFEKDRAFYLNHMWAMYEVSRMPMHERLEAADQLEARLEDPQNKRYMIASVLLPLMSRAMLLEVRTVAGVRCARVALAVERFRLSTGKPPETLDQLAPRFIETLPDDPFTGKPLIYKKLKTGYVVYSLGEDKEDNGGSETNEAGQQYEPGADIPFRVER